MKAKINKIYSQVEAWNSLEIDDLINELQVLSQDKFDKEQEE